MGDWIEGEFLDRLRQQIVVIVLDGECITGSLLGHDADNLFVRQQETSAEVMIRKQAVRYVYRAKGAAH